MGKQKIDVSRDIDPNRNIAIAPRVEASLEAWRQFLTNAYLCLCTFLGTFDTPYSRARARVNTVSILRV